MVETASSSLALGAIGTKIGGFIWDQLTKAAPDLLKKFQQKREVEKAVDNYLQRYMDAYGTIKPLGMTHSISLEQIYTEVQFTTEDLRVHFGQNLIEETAKWELRNRLDPEKVKTLDGIAAANQFQRMLVVGNPGGGKSIYLQRIGWECLRSHGIRQRDCSGSPHYDHELLPILLELKRCRSDETASLVELLAREFADCGFPENVEMVKALLTAGKLLVLLDALDEVAQDRIAAVVDQAQSLIRRYPDCRFIISCRIAFRHDYFKDFQDVTLLEFADEQISHFINNWFCGKEQQVERIAERFVSELHQAEHKATLELARSPVLLGYLCVGYQGTLQLSSNRAEIYRRALDIYLQEWNAKNLKTAHIRQVHDSLPPETELLMLAQIAYDSLERERFFLTRDEWLTCIRDFMADLVDRPKSLPVGSILENIAVSQGLVVQRTHQDWSFSHLTLQEYLAAYHIDQHGLMEDWVQKHLGDKRWEEVFLILAGMRPGVLLQTMVHVAAGNMLRQNPTWLIWKERLNAWDNSDGTIEGNERWVMVKVLGVYMCLYDCIISQSIGSESTVVFSHALVQALVRARSLTVDLSLGHSLGLNYMNDDMLTLIASLLGANWVQGAMRRDLLQMQATLKVRLHGKDIQFNVNGGNGVNEMTGCLLPVLESPRAAADYFENLRFILRCKKAGAKKLKASEWEKVLQQVF